MNKMLTASILVALSGLAGCAGMVPIGGVSSADYTRTQANHAQNVEYGVVTGSRAVSINTSTQTSSAVGTGVGAVVGGALGSLIGGGNGRTLAMALGAVGGGVAGNALEKNHSTQSGEEITVRLDSGRTIAVTQAGTTFDHGERVRVATDGQGITRVVPVE